MQPAFTSSQVSNLYTDIIYTAFQVLRIPIIFVVLRFKNFCTPPINHNQLYWYANIGPDAIASEPKPISKLSL